MQAMMTLQQALVWIQRVQPQARLVGDATVVLLRVHTDSRSVQVGDLFVALKGERMDGHAFLSQAKASGATAAIVHEGLDALGLPGIEVPNTTQALGALAVGWRAQFTLPLIAVTGSNGKTTVTQMIASILAAHVGHDATLATEGNFNNEIGVPLTLFRLNAQHPHQHRMAVVELGMNHPGEIAWLARMAQPTVALVNNAQREHQEFMHTVEAVARENGSVLHSLSSDGVTVLPVNDSYTDLWREMAGNHQLMTFGGRGADVQAVAAQWCDDGCWNLQLQTQQGACDCKLHIAGRHNVRNAQAAAACALAAGVPLHAIAQGLTAFRPVRGRSCSSSLQSRGHRITLVDDTYNANPDSVQAAIVVLADLPGPHLLVLGDMAEVGDQGVAFHTEVGMSARQAGIGCLLALGPQSHAAVAAFGVGAVHCADMASLILTVQQHIVPMSATGGSVLVKGSRSMKMERVVQALQTAASQECITCC